MYLSPTLKCPCQRVSAMENEAAAEVHYLTRKEREGGARVGVGLLWPLMRTPRGPSDLELLKEGTLGSGPL